METSPVVWVRNVPLGGDPGAEPELSAGIIYPQKELHSPAGDREVWVSLHG